MTDDEAKQLMLAALKEIAAKHYPDAPEPKLSPFGGMHNDIDYGVTVGERQAYEDCASIASAALKAVAEIEKGAL